MEERLPGHDRCNDSTDYTAPDPAHHCPAVGALQQSDQDTNYERRFERLTEADYTSCYQFINVREQGIRLPGKMSIYNISADQKNRVESDGFMAGRRVPGYG